MGYNSNERQESRNGGCRFFLVGGLSEKKDKVMSCHVSVLHKGWTCVGRRERGIMYR